MFFYLSQGIFCCSLQSKILHLLSHHGEKSGHDPLNGPLGMTSLAPPTRITFRLAVARVAHGHVDEKEGQEVTHDDPTN